MPVDPAVVKEKTDSLISGCGFIHTLHCVKLGYHWDQHSGPSDTVRAIITGFVYLGEVLSEKLDELYG